MVFGKLSKVVKVCFFDNFLTILREHCYTNVSPLIVREQQKRWFPDLPETTKTRAKKKKKRFSLFTDSTSHPPSLVVPDQGGASAAGRLHVFQVDGKLQRGQVVQKDDLQCPRTC